MAGWGASPPAAAVCRVPPPPPHLCSKPHCPAQQAAAAFCVPSKGYSLQLRAMSLCLSLHQLPSPLEAVLLSPPHCSLSPCPGLAAVLLLGLPGVGLGPPKSGSPPLGRGALPGPGSCSHMGTSISRAGGSPEDGSGARSAAYQLLPQSCLGLRHHCSRICLSARSQGLRQAGLGTLVAPIGRTRLAAEVAARLVCQRLCSGKLAGKQPHVASCAQHPWPWWWMEASVVPLVSVFLQMSSAGLKAHLPCVPHFHLHPGAVLVPQTAG